MSRSMATASRACIPQSGPATSSSGCFCFVSSCRSSRSWTSRGAWAERNHPGQAVRYVAYLMVDSGFTYFLDLPSNNQVNLGEPSSTLFWISIFLWWVIMIQINMVMPSWFKETDHLEILRCHHFLINPSTVTEDPCHVNKPLSSLSQVNYDY